MVAGVKNDSTIESCPKETIENKKEKGSRISNRIALHLSKNHTTATQYKVPNLLNIHPLGGKCLQGDQQVEINDVKL